MNLNGKDTETNYLKNMTDTLQSQKQFKLIQELMDFNEFDPLGSFHTSGGDNAETH